MLARLSNTHDINYRYTVAQQDEKKIDRQRVTPGWPGHMLDSQISV